MENQIETGSQEKLGVKGFQALFITKVYNWMAMALLITGVVAYLTATSPAIINAIVGSKLVFYGLLISELLLVIYLTSAINRLRSAHGNYSFPHIFFTKWINHVSHFSGLYIRVNCHYLLCDGEEPLGR